jgi:GntR family transcriptional regulator
MVVRIDRTSPDPLYLQIRSQIVMAIARSELVPGDVLPSVRSLASDLGINLHTVNKAYAVLRDEEYVTMHGRSGAYVADSTNESKKDAEEGRARLDDALYALALEHRAQGGGEDEYLACARSQADRAYEGDEQ